MNPHTPEQIASAYTTLDLALKHPHALDMSQWVNIVGHDSSIVDLDILTSDANQCGTTACYAGWHAARLGYMVSEGGSCYRGDSVWAYVGQAINVAARDLGLDHVGTRRLFLETFTSDLPAAVAREFGPRPVAS